MLAEFDTPASAVVPAPLLLSLGPLWTDGDRSQRPVWWPWDWWWNHLDFYQFSSISRSPPPSLPIRLQPPPARYLVWIGREHYVEVGVSVLHLCPLGCESVAAVSVLCCAPCCRGLQPGSGTGKGEGRAVRTGRGKGRAEQRHQKSGIARLCSVSLGRPTRFDQRLPILKKMNSNHSETVYVFINLPSHEYSLCLLYWFL